jgi:hypothetical protein
VTRFIHAPGEYRIDEQRIDTVYALLDDAGFVGLVTGEEVKLRTSDGTPVVLRLSDIGFERMGQIVYEEMLRRRQQAIDKELFARADAAAAEEDSPSP